MPNKSPQRVLITGASRGLGAAIARECAANNMQLILHYGQSHKAVHILAKELGDAVLDCISMDLSEPGAGGQLARAALCVAPNLGAVVNNAAIAESAFFEGSEQDWQSVWQKTLAVNLQAPADLCREMVNAFTAKSGGRIINIASRAAQRGDKLDFSAYAASKAGLVALTQTIAKGTADQNIVAYSIAPGWIDTDMAPSDPETRNLALSEIPMDRFADPAEVAKLVVFLLSDACRSASGATFDVNGASYLR